MRRQGRRIARQHRRRAHEMRERGEEMIEDIRGQARQVIGGQQAGYAAMGGRVRGAAARIGEEDVDIGEFDREAWITERREALEERLRGREVTDSEGRTRRVKPNEETRRAIRMQLAGLERAADQAEERWGIRLRDADPIDWTEDATRELRERGGSLMAVQHATISQVERDFDRVVKQTRRSMAAEYEAAREARKTAQAGAGGWEELATLLSQASQFYQAWHEFDALRPDMGSATGGPASGPENWGILSPNELYRRRGGADFEHYSSFRLRR